MPLPSRNGDLANMDQIPCRTREVIIIASIGRIDGIPVIIICNHLDYQPTGRGVWCCSSKAFTLGTVGQYPIRHADPHAYDPVSVVILVAIVPRMESGDEPIR